MRTTFSPLYEQARRVLQVRYGMTSAVETQLQELVRVTDNPATTAVAMQPQCVFNEQDGRDCLLMLEVLALEWQQHLQHAAPTDSPEDTEYE